jgi:hypothetical protein
MTIRVLLFFVIALEAPTLRAGDIVVSEMTYENCATGTAGPVKGEVCHVQDIVKKDGRWELTLKFGFFGETTVPGLGGGGSSAFVVKVTIPSKSAGTSEAARAYVVKHADEIWKPVLSDGKSKKKTLPPQDAFIRALKTNACAVPSDAFDELLKKNSCSVDE